MTDPVQRIAKMFGVPMSLLGVGTPPFKRNKRRYRQGKRFTRPIAVRNHWADWLPPGAAR